MFARALSILTAACLLLGGLFALRHETSVAHVRGALSGELEHAHALAEHHTQDAVPHLHGRDVEEHGEGGACALLAALDHSTVVLEAPATEVAAQSSELITIPVVAVELTARARYRLAPKTSPPARV